MTNVDCQYCNFKEYRLSGLGRGDHTAEFLVSVVKNHKCVFTFRGHQKLSSSTKGSLTCFNELEQKLQVRFYQICPPFIRKRLYSASKCISGLGEKPSTFIVRDIRFCDDEVVPEGVYDWKNAVIDVRRAIGLGKIGELDMKKMVRHFDFHHIYFGLWHSIVDKKLMKYFANSRIIGCDVDYSVSFPYITRTVSAVEYLTYRDILSKDWEKKLMKWNEKARKLKRLCIYPSEINDFGVLAEFMNARDHGFEMVLEEGSFDENELYKYFQPLKGNEIRRKKLLIIKPSDDSPEIKVTPKIYR
uniref:Uncharacterized protein n=1 Tax=Panagrolaimus sp. JU765 TaxID=591449 RepID=A0AC34Q4U5_9BILA